MVILMRVFAIFSILLIWLVSFPVLGQDEIDSSSGRVEVTPETEESVTTVPIDEETGTVNWADYSTLPAGGGAKFGFVTVLYPPDPAALIDCPEILLDGAWLPPVLFSSGFSPSGEGSLSTSGWWYLEDASGNLARRDMQIDDGYDSWFASTWFLGSGCIFHIEEGWTEGYVSENNYLPDEWQGPGIDYFLRSVWFRGILSGERMGQLLEYCGATRIGRDIFSGGRDRLSIYEIPASEMDRQNGRGSLMVWVTFGDWRLARTRLHSAYAIEVTEFENVTAEVSNDYQSYYSEYLPEDIYWSIDNYLLTHETPFFMVDEELGYTAPVATEVESDNSGTLSEGETSEDTSGGSEEG